MKKFELKKEHILLLQNSHWEWQDCEFGAPGVDCKRPYGNSSVYSDMIEILKWDIEEDEDGDIDQKTKDKLWNLHQETGAALEVILHAKSFDVGFYEADNYSNNWRKI